MEPDLTDRMITMGAGGCPHRGPEEVWLPREGGAWCWLGLATAVQYEAWMVVGGGIQGE